MDIEKYNLVNTKTFISTAYKVSNMLSGITIFLNRDGKLLIVGRIDNNYAAWISFTEQADRKRNEIIFNYIGSHEFRWVSQEKIAFQQVNFSYDELQDWYRTELIRTNVKGMEWQTPFGHYFADCDVVRQGYE